MCLYPRLIKNRKYIANKKNGGIIPTVTDERTLYVPIGCQNCIECRKQKSREWQTRLLEDIKTNINGKFITLTFSNESISELSKELSPLKGYPLDNAIATLATRRFLERYRKEYGKSLRHWLVTELGHNGTNNIHLHGIIWTNEDLHKIEKIWSYGFMWKGQYKFGKLINYVNEKTVGYITKYVTKKDELHTTYKSIILTSPGIGANYIKSQDVKQNEFTGEKTNETYRTRTGHKIALPIYWRNKIYNDEQKEQLWLNKLNKEERYVCGERISISKDLNGYYKLLDWHRTINKQLGYGTQTTNYRQKIYENEQRHIMQLTRIAKAKTPSAGSLAKGNGLNIKPPTFENTLRSKGRGIEELWKNKRRNVENLIWITKNKELNLQYKYKL